MQVVEQTIISKHEPRYAALDAAAFASKNLWNAANYLVRQTFIYEHVYLDNVKVFHLIKGHEAYKALPAKVSNQVLIQLHKAWVAFFEAIEAWRSCPEKFRGRPKLPGYKDKLKGRNLLVYEKGAISKRALKSINQGFNKQGAELQSKLHRPGTSARLERLTHKRNRRIQHYLHTASKRIIDLLVEQGIGTLVVGKNPFWKQNVELGKRNNQHFVQLPHARFIDLLRYKAELAGIQFIEQGESYSSKASFLDLDDIPTYDPKRTEKPHFSGKREHRGLYRAANGRRINADVNGSLNIGRKAFPNSARHGIEVRAVAPVWLPVLTAQSRALTEAGAIPTNQ